MFQAVRWASRRGLREEGNLSRETKGETYAYWYLRRNGYVFVARNYTPRGIKGELDLVGYDGKTLAFVEVRTRTVRDDMPALPETERYARKTTRRGAHCAALPRRMPDGRMSLPLRRCSH
jgi:putative endonuclease